MGKYTAREEILHYAQNCAEEFGWSRKKAIEHILATHKHLVKQAIAEDEQHELQKDPQGIIMRLAAKEYERNPNQSRLGLFKKVFHNNPILFRAYDDEILGRSSRFYDASGKLAEKAHTYSKEHNVDLMAATKKILIENPALARVWHSIGKSPD